MWSALTSNVILLPIDMSPAILPELLILLPLLVAPVAIPLSLVFAVLSSADKLPGIVGVPLKLP